MMVPVVPLEVDRVCMETVDGGVGVTGVFIFHRLFDVNLCELVRFCWRKLLY